MDQLLRHSPINGEKWISIHDMHLSSILWQKNSVSFIFENGFIMIENDQIKKKEKGVIELCGCSPSDCSCRIIKRKRTRLGTKTYGRTVSLENLNKILIKKKQYIEIVLELYDANYMYWRGEMLPNRKTINGLAPYVTIEIMGFFPMKYSWK